MEPDNHHDRELLIRIDERLRRQEDTLEQLRLAMIPLGPHESRIESLEQWREKIESMGIRFALGILGTIAAIVLAATFASGS